MRGKVLARKFPRQGPSEAANSPAPRAVWFHTQKFYWDLVLAQRLRDFPAGLFAAYVDLRKVLDPANRTGDVLWKILVPRGIPPELVELISDLYFCTQIVATFDGTISVYFSVSTGVGQGCVFASTLSNTCVDHVLGRMEKSGCGVSFGLVRITDLEFVDDAVIFTATPEVLAEAPELLSEEAEPLGLRVSSIKIKIKAFCISWMRQLSQFL